MAVFKYVTRGEQTAQGKQKVYFCAHPDDYGRYFEKISNEILNTLEKENNRNCAFFYLEDANAERDDDFKFSFKEMNLVVMPVTTRLLTTKNPALDIEFKLAEEYGIPVLPLMMESGLESVFNAKCGDIQFLDPNSHDVTAISYEEKLTKYLTSVLIGDELAEKIRKAFDAYIFLSYRKKDRKYAQELMRLIHKNEFCRDIAIWYDEFLTPGEDFNKSIEEALKKSKLFALAVTPSLLEKSKDKDGNECENYIVAKEYPMAKERTIKDKKFSILPAEIVETDKTALSEKYDGIPDCVRSDDESALSASLENALEGIALRENDNDPEHNFFIGLAYLGGIDVEKDHERAIKLITSSAEAGLPEAMEKLVSIYRNGEIGARDYEKAIEWQKKLVKYRKKVYESTQDEDSAADYLNDLRKLGDFLYEIMTDDSISAATDEYKKLLDESIKIQAKFNTQWTARGVMIAYSKIGNIYKALDKVSTSEEYFSEAFIVAQRLFTAPYDNEKIHDLSLAYFNLADIYVKQQNIEKAKEYYYQVYVLFYTILQTDKTVEALSWYAMCLDNLGYCEELNKEYGKAIECYEEALKIRLEIFSSYKSNESLNGVLTAYNRVGIMWIHNNDANKALPYFLNEYRIAQTIHNDTPTLKSKENLAVSYDDLGDVYLILSKYNIAENNYKKALELRIEIEECAQTPASKRLLSISYFKIGKLYQEWNKYESAYLYYKKDLSIAQIVANITNSLDDLFYLSVSFSYLGFISRLNNKYDNAIKYCNEALSIRLHLLQKSNTIHINYELSNIYNEIGDIYYLKESFTEAEFHYIEALKIREMITPITNDVQIIRDLSVSYVNVSKIALIKGNLKEAIEYTQKSIILLKNLVRTHPCQKFFDDLAITYFHASFIELEKREEYLYKALNIWLSLSKEYPDNPDYINKVNETRRQLGI